jgi:hypothetical protein
VRIRSETQGCSDPSDLTVQLTDCSVSGCSKQAIVGNMYLSVIDNFLLQMTDEKIICS